MYENSAAFWRITHKISLGFDTVQIYVRLHRAILGKGGEFSLSREMSGAKQMIYTTINSFCIYSFCTYTFDFVSFLDADCSCILQFETFLRRNGSRFL